MTKGTLPYTGALALANDLQKLLAPACERILVAGSLRRRLPEVGDLDLVALPRYDTVTNLFGEAVGRRSLLDDLVWEVAAGQMTKVGPRQKQFRFGGLQCELWIPAGPECWGAIATIRTGSADFAKWLVTSQTAGGACPPYMRFSEGRLIAFGGPLDTPEEQDVFRHLKLDWIEPEDRVAGRWPR